MELLRILHEAKIILKEYDFELDHVTINLIGRATDIKTSEQEYLLEIKERSGAKSIDQELSESEKNPLTKSFAEFFLEMRRKNLIDVKADTPYHLLAKLNVEAAALKNDTVRQYNFPERPVQ